MKSFIVTVIELSTSLDTRVFTDVVGSVPYYLLMWLLQHQLPHVHYLCSLSFLIGNLNRYTICSIHPFFSEPLLRLQTLTVPICPPLWQLHLLLFIYFSTHKRQWHFNGVLFTGFLLYWIIKYQHLHSTGFTQSDQILVPQSS